MISFAQFIYESAEAASAFVSAKKIAPYISSERYRTSFTDALNNLSAAADENEIYNARFNDYKSSVSRGIEYAYKTLFDKIRQDIIDSGQETSDLWSITSMTDINKVSKIYNKMPVKNKEASNFMAAIIDLPNALKIMKSYVKTGKPPAVPKPGQFIKPVASLNASKLAINFMKEAVSTFEENLRDSVTKENKTAFDNIKNITEPSKLPKTPTAVNVATMIFVVRSAAGKKTLELMPNAEARLDKLTNNTIDDIVSGFVSKNASKLALVLQKKGAPKSHNIIKTNIRNGMVENTMEFEFDDGSSFILESSVVYKYSKSGKLFFQYPTRFKNVKLADGSIMRMPSEEKMIKEF